MVSHPRKYALIGAAVGVPALGLAGVLVWKLRSGDAQASAKPPPTDTPVHVTDRGRQYYAYKGTRSQAGHPLRDMDIEILEVINQGSWTERDIPDLFPAKPYRVHFQSRAPGEKWVDVVLIDTDRDGKWDERWELREEELERRIINRSDPSVGIPYSLRHGCWVPR
jgi:hypothetical protein